MGNDPRQKRSVLLGSLLLAGLLALAVLIFVLDGLLSELRPRYTVVAVVQNAADLTAGSPVWIAGREVGEVLNVGFMPANEDTLSRVAVTLRLPRSVSPQVRADSRVRLTSVSLISEPVVDILPGTAAAAPLQPGDTLRQDLRPTPVQLAARAAVVKAGLDSVLIEAGDLAPALRTRLLQTQRTFRGLDLVMQEAARLQTDVDGNAGLALLQDPSFAASLNRVTTSLAEMPQLLSRLGREDGAARQVATALSRLQARADSLDALLATASQMATPTGSFARFQQDTAIQVAIGRARAELDSLIAEIRRNPLRFGF